MAISLQKHGENWEHLAQLDPLWAILSDKNFRYGKWDDAEFFKTGEITVAAMMTECTALGHPRMLEAALDFGCGVGRLTFALGQYFQKVTGLDISPTMLKKAHSFKAVRPGGERCEFVLGGQNHLGQFATNSFDLVYTTIVLQHVPRLADIESYIREFVRVVRPGGMICFQLPYSIPWRNRVQLRRRVFDLCTAAGMPAAFLYQILAIHPIQIRSLPASRVEQILSGEKAKLLKKMDNTGADDRVRSLIYFATK